MKDAVDEQSSIHEYARILWSRRWVVLGMTLACLGLSLAYSVTATRVYEGSASLLLAPQLPTTVLQANNAVTPALAVDVPTSIQVIESASVSDLVNKSVPGAPPVTATQVGTTNVVTVAVDSTDPQLAARAATAYANAYLQSQRQQTAATLSKASSLLQSHLDAVQNTITAVHNEVASTGAANAGVQSELAALQAALQTEAQAIEGQLTTYQFFASSQADESGQVLTTASVPTTPIKPKTTEYAILATILGIVLGIGTALVLEFFDDGIRSKEDLERAVANLPVLGLVPDIGSWRNPDAAYLISRSAPVSAPAGAYRSIRTSIQFLGLERSIRTLQFTSPSASEGKTATVANLGVVTAQAGLRVVMVCCDLRRPRLHDYFGMSNRVGFTSVLLQERTLDEALQPVPGLENLQLLASGPIPPNPSELISGARSAELLQALAERADLVLIDSPPVTPLSDAAALAGRVDAVVLVASAGIVTRGHLGRALERLDQVDAPILGIVLNRAGDAEDPGRQGLGNRRERDRSGRAGIDDRAFAIVASAAESATGGEGDGGGDVDYLS
ncbi:MAG TPA: polysaccharide biosynthesis tyrosine autokinase [Acidimicrobiales bacterium]|nr:polysaccharide biosynthesis tyrosine autokinase [Acidimicrobiales bacterium]